MPAHALSENQKIMVFHYKRGRWSRVFKAKVDIKMTVIRQRNIIQGHLGMEGYIKVVG